MEVNETVQVGSILVELRHYAVEIARQSGLVAPEDSIGDKVGSLEEPSIRRGSEVRNIRKVMSTSPAVSITGDLPCERFEIFSIARFRSDDETALLVAFTAHAPQHPVETVHYLSKPRS